MGEHEEHIAFEMGYNKGFKDGIKGSIPKADYENRLKADMVAMLEELKEQLREMHEDFFETEHFDEAYGVSDSMDIIQQKIDLLQKQTTDNCDSCFNGTTKGGCAVKELMKNKDCKYYMPRKINSLKEKKNESY